MTHPNTEQPADTSLDEALLKGLANHSNEFLNPWFFRTPLPSHEDLGFALDRIMNHSRLKERILSWHQSQTTALLKRVREEVIQSDEPMPLHVDYQEAAIMRDELRAEQRKALDSLEKEMKG